MINVVVDARMCMSSGIGRYLVNLLSYMKSCREVNISCIVQRQHMSLEIFSGVKHLKFFDSRIYSLSEQFLLPAKIHSCDLFWSPHYNIPFFPIRARRRVVTIHDVLHLSNRSEFSLCKQMYAWLFMNRAVKISDMILTVSDFSKSEILKLTHAKLEKIKVIKNGVDASFFSRSFSEQFAKELIARYSPPSQYFLFVGNIKAHKNLRSFLDAYKLFIKCFGSNVKLVIIGREYDDYPLKKEVYLNNDLRENVFFFSDVSDQILGWFYSNAIASILPSFYEGFGFIPLESMCAGCPAIVSRSGSIPEVCSDAVHYIDPRCHFDIFNGLRVMYQDEVYRQVLIEKGNQLTKKFIWQKAAKDHISSFLELF